MDGGEIIEADWTWMDGAFRSGVAVAVDARGQIESVGGTGRPSTLPLKNQALLPGMVNVHSHAFQRGLRGRAQTIADDAGTFWSWREEMYRLADTLTSESLYALSRQAFSEMLAAGITGVGEFHYVRHGMEGRRFELDDVVLQAAADAGIRIVLLPAYYRTGGIGKAASGAQGRFTCASPDEYWRQWERLLGHLHSETQSLGACVHSVRAAEPEEIAALHSESRRRNLVFHIHVEEQQAEIDDCQTAYARTPMALFEETLQIDSRLTGIHCTHTGKEDLARFLARGGNVCICPLTEADLADGIADVPAILSSGGRICLGTDSNVRICMTEEMRWLEYVQRLRCEKRGICRTQDGSCARALFEMATVNGASALGLPVGRIAPGLPADFFTLDLTAPSLAGWTPETLLDSFIFGAGDEVISGVCVQGCWIRRP